jgi:hypothetical protein
MISLAHIVNPAVVDSPNDLVIAQPITFETMSVARKFAAGAAAVNLYAVQFRGEARVPLPEGFARVPDLTRSILDIRTFKKNRKLPLIRDILDALRGAAGAADYYVYTNADIALQPYFYLSVAKIIEQGYDAFVINRRTIPAGYHDVKQIPLMYAEAGDAHPGYDCFVFRSDVYPRFVLGDICIGSAWIGRALLANMAAFSARFKEFKNEHLTFHIGDSLSWRQDDYQDYSRENRKEYVRIFGELEKKRGGFSPPWRSYLLDSGDKRRFPDFEQWKDKNE